MHQVQGDHCAEQAMDAHFIGRHLSGAPQHGFGGKIIFAVFQRQSCLIVGTIIIAGYAHRLLINLQRLAMLATFLIDPPQFEIRFQALRRVVDRLAQVMDGLI